MDTPPREISRGRWDGQPLAEAHADGTWSDYIFANGQRIARADNYETVLHMSGVNAQSCSGEYFSLGIIALSPYTHVVQAGDILNFRQYQTGPGTIGGLALYFSNNDISYFHSVPDTDGQDLGADATMNAWHYRTVDLSQFAGESLGSVRLINTGGAPPGQFDLYFDDIAVTSPDGTVLPVFSKTPGVGVEGGVAGPAECVSNLAVTDETSGSSSVAALAPKDTTTYYHGDQIGSARLLTVGGGWAVWSGTYTPYGQEINPAQINPPNFYKFTGKERDEEEGSYLDYFGARYYNSTMGRFMSADYSYDNDPEPVPHADLENPQSLNLYSYVQNNPLSNVDPDGHSCDQGTIGPDGTLTFHCQNDPASNLALAGGAVMLANEELGPVAWGVGGALLGVGCIQAHCGQAVASLFSKKGNNSPTPPIVIPNTGTPNPDPNNKQSSTKKTSRNQMQKQVERGQAPKTVDRVDPGLGPNEQDHIHFSDGNALNEDGTWKHGSGRPLTNAETGWIQGNGWNIPK